MKRWISRLLFAAVFWGLAGTAARADSVSAARGVLERVVGTNMTSRIVLDGSLAQVDGRDVYEYSASGGVLTVSGSSAVAMCRGVYDYLRANNLGTVGWAGPRLNLPAQWPDAALVQGETPFKIRHCYNVVTAGYTFPFWTWDRWQQELDWLAMHGYNMIMAPVATEAILTRVWTDIELTQAEIDAYFNGPAHLPWNRMGNVRQVGGTLTDAWHTDQIALQHQILNRARELGIEPVVQCFAGFVPPGITRIYTGQTLHTSTAWGGFSSATNITTSIMPGEPHFAELMKRYIDQWYAEFGDAKYYLVDSFNEMKLAGVDPGTYGANTYSALIAADADAVWVLQGWMFTYDTDTWTTTAVDSLMNSVPANNRLLVLDYANDYTEFYNKGQNAWQRYSAFRGKSWVMGYVPNMGGKTAYTGKMNYYASQAATTVTNANRGNLVGFTISGEGFDNNEALFELMSDTAWSTNAISLATWLPAYARNRYGQSSAEAASAWEQLRASVYSSFYDHPAFGWQKQMNNQWFQRGTVYQGGGFIQAVRTFLSASSTLGGNPNYRDDAIEMTALALGLYADEYFVLANAAFDSGNSALCQAHANNACTLLLQADRLLESHSQHRLQRWIDLARAHSGTPAEKNAYERSARQIVTVWGPPINDYSCRVWSGLIRDFYVPRMQALIAAKLANQTFDRATWEAAWVNSTGVSSVTPYPDPVARARELFDAVYTNPIITPVGVKFKGTASAETGINLGNETNIINGNGLSGTLLSDGSNLNIITHTNVTFTAPGNAWVTTAPGGSSSDFFASTSNTVVFGFDLGGPFTGIDTLLSWGYHFGSNNGNSISKVTLYFSTDGGATTNGFQTVSVPLPATYNQAAVAKFSPVTANYITMVVTDNHYGNAGGGDRVGIAEIRFARTPSTPVGALEPGKIVPVSGGQGLTLSWDSAIGQSYTVLYKTNLVTQAAWNVYQQVTGAGGSVTITNALDRTEGYFLIESP